MEAFIRRGLRSSKKNVVLREGIRDHSEGDVNVGSD
jgi:hypothetical protein